MLPAIDVDEAAYPASGKVDYQGAVERVAASGMGRPSCDHEAHRFLLGQRAAQQAPSEPTAVKLHH